MAKKKRDLKPVTRGTFKISYR